MKLVVCNINAVRSSMALSLVHFIILILLYQALNSNPIIIIEEQTTEEAPCNYPNGSIACKVWNYTNLDCTSRELVCIPSFPHAASVKLLDLSWNKINLIPDHAFTELHSLQSLILNSNELNHITDDAFTALHSLQSLVLSRNRISFLQNEVFGDLQELEHLQMSGNSISTLYCSAFVGLHMVKTLDLSTFSGLYNLQSLDMSGNSLTQLGYAFTGLQELLKLDLSGNPISNINESNLRGLKKLLHLDLSGESYRSSELELSTDSPFRDLMSLETLNNNDRDFSQSIAMFVGLKSLQKLTIKIFSFDTVTEAPFTGLLSLNYLDVNIDSTFDTSNCKIIENSFSGLEKLEYLRLQHYGNSQVCSDYDLCSLTSLKTLKLINGNIQRTHECMKRVPLKDLHFTSKFQ